MDENMEQADKSKVDKTLEAVKHGAGVAAEYAGVAGTKIASTVRERLGVVSTDPKDYLHSWNDTATRAAIVEFVQAVTTEGPDFVEPRERIAVFDNDGTLWSENPAYFQFLFAIERFREIGADNPELSNSPIYKAVAANDLQALAAEGEHGLLEIMAATHSGMTTEEFVVVVEEWVETARHPRFERPFAECIFAPMREVLDYLRANQFKTFIVSGGGIEFMRVFAEKSYGIPPEQVVGSSGKVTYEVRDGKPDLVKQAAIDFIDDKEGKAVGINQFIGRRPIIAFGNSDGDFQMLEYTTAGSGMRLGLIVHHDDADREYAYDRGAHFGALERGLDEAEERGWLLISMKDDWNQIFA